MICKSGLFKFYSISKMKPISHGFEVMHLKEILKTYHVTKIKNITSMVYSEFFYKMGDSE